MAKDFKYILFTHLPKPEAWETLEKVAAPLGEALDSTDAPGMLVAFCDAGWISLLNTIGTDFDPVRMKKEFEEIDGKEEIIRRIVSHHKALAGRLRLVTAKSLYQILNNLRGNKPGLAAAQLRRFLVGDEPGVRYDTTKVVEAIIRIRHLGSGIPVLRMDWDALLSNRTLEKGLLATLTRDIPRHCTEMANNHRIHSYLLSGTYCSPKGDYRDWTINEFNTAFATRMFPALIPSQEVCTELDNLSVEDSKNGEILDGPLDEAVFERLAGLGLFDQEVMLKYYGLGDFSSSQENYDFGGGSSSQEGLARIGSDPERSVISGAALVLSDGAIHDLPPFSNFRQSVMWIDDYLKYELHRSLGHFSEAITGDPNSVPQRFPSQVYKDRLLAGQGDLRKYTLGQYLPVLCWGILMDAWIRGEDPSTGGLSPFVMALEQSLKRGTFGPPERDQLAKSLLDIAVARINKLITIWSSLQTRKGCKSFAALWVSGDRQAIESVIGKELSWPGTKSLVWGLLKQPGTNISSLDALREPVREVVFKLVEDMCTYIDWALEWPKFIQSVRAVRNGSLELDVRYPGN